MLELKCDKEAARLPTENNKRSDVNEDFSSAAPLRPIRIRNRLR